MTEEANPVKTVPPKDAYDIYVVGTGIIPAFHLTREAEAAMQMSTEILFVDKSFAIEDVLGRYGAKLTDLHGISYREGVDRLDAYREMASVVVNAALANPPVTLALYGHPLIYSLPPFIVLAAAKMMDLRVKILPAISSLDTLFVDLQIDPCTQGLQMYEATDLLLRQRPIQPDVPCIIWQIGSVGTRLFTRSPSAPGRFDQIKAYLQRFYPDETRMFGVYCASMPLVPSSITEFTLGTIEEVGDELHQGVTVYIPPPTVRDIADQQVLEDMDDADYLQKLTVQPT